MKKHLLIVALLALALASCSHRESDGIVAPTWSCTQTPTGEKSVKMVSEYCGRACSREVPQITYAVRIACDFTEWRTK